MTRAAAERSRSTDERDGAPGAFAPGATGATFDDVTVTVDIPTAEIPAVREPRTRSGSVRSRSATARSPNGAARSPNGAVRSRPAGANGTRTPRPRTLAPRGLRRGTISDPRRAVDPRASGRRARNRRIRRIALLVLAVALVPVGVSYVRAITAPGSDSLGVKSVEWLRTHGGRGIVAWVENEWYSHHKPPVGGKPTAGLTGSFVSTIEFPNFSNTLHLAAPPPVTPIVSPPLPNEGQWSPAGRLVDGIPAVYTTYVRPDPVYSSVVAGVAWMDTKLLKAALFSGSQVPGGTSWTHQAPTSPQENAQLVAEFNSGFLLQDANGGYYSEGRTVTPLVTGSASLVIYDNGSATVAKWGRDATMTADVSAVRQNLELIVDGRKPVPGIETAGSSAQWGYTLGNKVLVWRSGLGVTADGALVYVAGKDLSVYSLANVLAHAGAVRAMELDINTDWVNFFSFSPMSGQPAAPSNGTKLLDAMVQSTARYFHPSSRDFVALFANPQQGAPQPAPPPAPSGRTKSAAVSSPSR